MSALVNFPECTELSVIKSRKVFSSAEKRSKAEKIWGTLSSSHPLRDRVTESEEVIRISHAIDD